MHFVAGMQRRQQAETELVDHRVGEELARRVAQVVDARVAEFLGLFGQRARGM
ncbi:hypothetical protein HFP05_15705 [Rhodanobacter denitrificans]|nr:hypothetical protein [Rhodanobacter denitrificans]